MSQEYETCSAEGAVHQIFSCLLAGGMLRLQIKAVRLLAPDRWGQPIYTLDIQSTNACRPAASEFVAAQDLVKISEFCMHVANQPINVNEVNP